MIKNFKFKVALKPRLFLDSIFVYPQIEKMHSVDALLSGSKLSAIIYVPKSWKCSCCRTFVQKSVGVSIGEY